MKRHDAVQTIVAALAKQNTPALIGDAETFATRLTVALDALGLLHLAAHIEPHSSPRLADLVGIDDIEPEPEPSQPPSTQPQSASEPYISRRSR